jgi:hypothetical protein
MRGLETVLMLVRVRGDTAWTKKERKEGERESGEVEK